MNNKERQKIMRQLASAATPWQDRLKFWFIKWTIYTVIAVLVYLLLDAYASGGIK